MSTPTRRNWTDETIRTELLPVAEELGRMPSRAELTARGIGGIWAAMGRRGGVDAWREVVATHLAPRSTADVEVAAYLLYLSGHPGDHVAHWFAAEQALQAA